MSLRARDILRGGEILTISPEATLDDVVAVLLDREISGLPVVAADGKVVGLVSQRDVLRRLREACEDESNGAGSRVREWKVGEIMRTDVQTVTPDTELSRVAAILLRHRMHRVPVVEDGRLVGIISTTDFLRPLESPSLMARLVNDPDICKYWTPFTSVNDEPTYLP